MEQLELTPVHSDDPDSSREAADRARPSATTQLGAVLTALEVAGERGLSNREIQVKVCGHNPGHPAWNKIPTRCRTLERQGLIELVTNNGEPVLRSHDGKRFMVWRIRGSRATSSGHATGPERGVPG